MLKILLHNSYPPVVPLADITHTLPLYIKHRLPAYVKLHREPRQLGLIGARLAGAKAATGDAIIILDSHCEATEVTRAATALNCESNSSCNPNYVLPRQGWIEPLLQRIKDKPSNIVIPQIDGISDRNLEFNGHPGGISISVGGFTWHVILSITLVNQAIRRDEEGLVKFDQKVTDPSTRSGHFNWISYKHDRSRKASDPAPTATMAGGLFGVDREFFFKIGSYDAGMTGWCGENLGTDLMILPS